MGGQSGVGERRWERYKIFLEHRLEVRRILLEKLLLGGLVLAAAVSGNYLIEVYKSDSEQSRFLFEERLEKLTELRADYGALVEEFFHASNLKNSGQPDYEGYKVKTQDMIKKINRASVLFPPGYDLRFNMHTKFHEAVSAGVVTLEPKEYGFIQAVADDFDDMTRALLWKTDFLTDDGFDNNAFPFENDPSLKKFFEKNIAIWRASQQTTPRSP